MSEMFGEKPPSFIFQRPNSGSLLVLYSSGLPGCEVQIGLLFTSFLGQGGPCTCSVNTPVLFD